MVGGTGRAPRSKQSRGKPRPVTLSGARHMPWPMIGAGVVVVALIGLIAYNLAPRIAERAETQKYVPNA